MLSQAHVYIKGDVIGVGFRAWTKIQAKSLGISGWVKNVFDRQDIFESSGGVEAVFQGDEDKVKEIVAIVEKGPPIAIVEDVDLIWQDVKEIYEGFEIRK